MTRLPARGCRLPARAWTLALPLLAACGREAAIDGRIPDADTVVVFTTVGQSVVTPLFDTYAERTGTRVVTIHGEIASLTDANRNMQRPKPDLLVADSLLDLTHAVARNVLRPTRSEVISGRVPANLRDPEHFWTALGWRARAVAYNTEQVGASELASVSGYASLAAEAWRGRLCLTSSSEAANTSLIARLIGDLGVLEAEMLVRRWRANLAGPVFADDVKLLQAIAAGQCATGIADSGVIARFIRDHPGARIAAHRFPADESTHVEASGGGVTRHARNPQGAALLLEWLTSAEANSRFAAARFELPANPQASRMAALWPGFEARPASLANLGFLMEDAIDLAARAHYP